MGDSDSDYGDMDFITGGSSTVQSLWCKQDLKEAAAAAVVAVADTSVNLTDDSFVETPRKCNVATAKTRNKGKENSKSDKNLVSSPSKRPSETPPLSPVKNDVTGRNNRTVRGSNRTKKTTQALKRLDEKKKGKATRGKPKRSSKNFNCFNADPDAIDIDDDTFEIKVRWKTDMLRVEIREEERMGTIMDRVAAMVHVQPGDIGFLHEKENGDESHGTEWISRDKTASNLELSVLSILEARMRDSENPDETDVIELKVQTKDRRASVMIKIRKSDKMEVLMEKFCKVKDLDRKFLRFYFDGETLDPEETSESLDLDGGECIDVHQIE